ncbi:hypothetical protein GWO59_003500 [Corynebacterium macginleyi]|nr:hypothetical protein [Corynebacterium macginleyi]
MIRTASRRNNVGSCQWCGKDIDQGGRGRPRKFCSASCKQRAYEQRNNVSGTEIPADAVILSPDKVQNLRDGLFELRCSAEDIQTAAEEGASAEELSSLCEELISLSRRLEGLR